MITADGLSGPGVGDAEPRQAIEAMVTLAQLRAEPYWDREVVTPELRWLGDQLCARLGRPRTAAGDRGDTGHLYGAHRSQEWIRNSRWCTNRSYTVQPNLTATEARRVAAFDFTPGTWGTVSNRAAVRDQTRMLVDAGMARRLPGVFEVLGTLNGRTSVGVDVPEGQTWSADPSHLDHVHLTLDRRRVADRTVMERILAVALGEDDDMATSKDEWLTLNQYDGVVKTPPDWGSDNEYLSIANALAELLQRSVTADRALPGLVASVGKVAADTGKALAAQSASLAAIAAALTSLTRLVETGGGDTDIAALVARLDTLTAAVSGVQAGQATLVAANDGLRSDLATMRGRLATAYGP